VGDKKEIAMSVPTGVLRAVTHLIAVVASVLLVLVFTAVLPFGLGSVVQLGMIVAVGLVAGGVGEGPAVRLASRASAPTASDRQVLATVPDLNQSRTLVCRSAATPVVMMGRFTIVSAALVEAIESGQVSTRDVTALTVHAQAYHLVAAPRRGEVAFAIAERPARMVVGVFRGAGRVFARVPLSSPAWRWRGMVGAVCLVQSVAEGRTWPGLLAAVVIALSYLVPAASQVIEARATAAGDAEVVAAGIGEVLIEVLGQGGQRLSSERRQRLQASPRSGPTTAARPAPPAPARHLHLVRT
jgi:hypothetical protein